PLIADSVLITWSLTCGLSFVPSRALPMPTLRTIFCTRGAARWLRMPNFSDTALTTSPSNFSFMRGRTVVPHVRHRRIKRSLCLLQRPQHLAAPGGQAHLRPVLAGLEPNAGRLAALGVHGRDLGEVDRHL